MRRGGGVDLDGGGPDSDGGAVDLEGGVDLDGGGVDLDGGAIDLEGGVDVDVERDVEMGRRAIIYSSSTCYGDGLKKQPPAVQVYLDRPICDERLSFHDGTLIV